MPDASADAGGDRDRAGEPDGAAPRHPARDRTGLPPRVWALSALLLLQTLCAAFFVGDVALDLLARLAGASDAADAAGESGRHLGLELLAAVALVASLPVTALEMRRLLLRQRRMEAQLRAASGAFLELMEEHFDGWGLTPSERDVAMLAIKGLAIAEIARLRETRPGTVKAQLGAIYAKAGVSGRPQLISLFVEDLMGAGLGDAAAGRRASFG